MIAIERFEFRVSQALPTIAVILLGLTATPVVVSAQEQASPSEALAAIRAKAEQGDADAQNSLGFIYDRGLLGVAKDKDEAIEWYTKAGDQGSGAAQGNLCSLHASSLQDLFQGVRPPEGQPVGPIEPVTGSKEDVAELMNWCRKAADQGSAQSMRHLGLFYAKGARSADGAELVKPDYEEAYFWLSLGMKDAFLEEIGSRLSEERRKAADERVRVWIEAARNRPPAVPAYILDPPD